MDDRVAEEDDDDDVSIAIAVAKKKEDDVLNGETKHQLNNRRSSRVDGSSVLFF